MKKMPALAFGLTCFVFGAIVQTGLANPGDFWHWVGAGGSYLGVPPQQSEVAS